MQTGKQNVNSFLFLSFNQLLTSRQKQDVISILVFLYSIQEVFDIQFKKYVWSVTYLIYVTGLIFNLRS